MELLGSSETGTKLIIEPAGLNMPGSRDSFALGTLSIRQSCKQAVCSIFNYPGIKSRIQIDPQNHLVVEEGICAEVIAEVCTRMMV
jgi:hypothetical protein